MPGRDADISTLSICLTCRDGREGLCGDRRGGERLAQAVLARFGAASATPGLRLRGVRCMSQCKRPCVAALTAPGRFAYIFGDLDPENREHADALLALAPLHAAAPEGFLRREARPEALRARILGRLPPQETASDLVSPLCAAPSSMGASA
ncbi:MAG: DUF1636 domain-containing protein [Rhodobacteraceae bacterium]|nr:MAG: DUF1636 domain-containing protein [Paracoccaceae bacterium]